MASAQELNILGHDRRAPLCVRHDVIELERLPRAAYHAASPIALPHGELDGPWDAPAWSWGECRKLAVVLFPLSSYKFELEHPPRAFDLLVVDNVMPDVTGLELVRELAQQPPGERPQIVMMTAHGSTQIVREAFKLGVEDFLYFPEGVREFFWMSDRDGYQHIYRYDYAGKLLNQVTRGKYMVTRIEAIDGPDHQRSPGAGCG